MPRTPNQPEGLKKMTRDFNIHEQGDGPNSFDTQKRGDFNHVPVGMYHVADYGAPKTPTGGLGSPASATFTAGRVVNPNSMRATREMPERQEPGSMISGGLKEPERSGKLSKG